MGSCSPGTVNMTPSWWEAPEGLGNGAAIQGSRSSNRQGSSPGPRVQHLRAPFSAVTTDHDHGCSSCPSPGFCQQKRRRLRLPPHTLISQRPRPWEAEMQAPDVSVSGVRLLPGRRPPASPRVLRGGWLRAELKSVCESASLRLHPQDVIVPKGPPPVTSGLGAQPANSEDVVSVHTVNVSGIRIKGQTRACENATPSCDN